MLGPGRARRSVTAIRVGAGHAHTLIPGPVSVSLPVGKGLRGRGGVQGAEAARGPWTCRAGSEGPPGPFEGRRRRGGRRRRWGRPRRPNAHPSVSSARAAPRASPCGCPTGPPGQRRGQRTAPPSEQEDEDGNAGRPAVAQAVSPRRARIRTRVSGDGDLGDDGLYSRRPRNRRDSQLLRLHTHGRNTPYPLTVTPVQPPVFSRDGERWDSGTGGRPLRLASVGRVPSCLSLSQGPATGSVPLCHQDSETGARVLKSPLPQTLHIPL